MLEVAPLLCHLQHYYRTYLNTVIHTNTMALAKPIYWEL